MLHTLFFVKTSTNRGCSTFESSKGSKCIIAEEWKGKKVIMTMIIIRIVTMMVMIMMMMMMMVKI